MALSKTAKASMVKEVKKVAVETPEESLRQLRLNLAAGLYVTPDRIKILLDAYDQAKEQIMMQSWVRTLENGKSYRVSLVHDEVSVEELKPEDVYASFTTELGNGIVSPFDREAIKNAVLGASYGPTIRQVMEEEENAAPRPMPGSGE